MWIIYPPVGIYYIVDFFSSQVVGETRMAIIGSLAGLMTC